MINITNQFKCILSLIILCHLHYAFSIQANHKQASADHRKSTLSHSDGLPIFSHRPIINKGGSNTVLKCTNADLTSDSKDIKGILNLNVTATAATPATSDIIASNLLTSSSTIETITSNYQSSKHSSILHINLMMFFLFTTLGSSQPFLPIYYRKIGISDNIIGVLGAITPAVTFIVSPLWGALADQTGWYKGIMLATFLGSLLSRLLLALENSNLLWLCTIVGISAILNAPVKPLMDTAVMSMLKDKSEYGQSRLYGQMGFGVGAYISGSFTSSSLQPMFMVQAMLGLPTAILMTFFSPKKIEKVEKVEKTIGNNKHVNHIVTSVTSYTIATDSNSSSSSSSGSSITSSAMISKLPILDGNNSNNNNNNNNITTNKATLSNAIKHIIQDANLLTFFTLVFLIGISCGIVENFAYVRLTELGGAKNNCIGISRLISTCVGGPMFYFSGKITKKIGVNKIMGFSLLAYVIRFLIYATIKNPWHALPAEILRGMSFATFWAGCTYHVYNNSPKGLTATMLGILNGVYNGLGQSVGALIGGSLSRHYGIAKTFMFTSIADAVVLVLFMFSCIFHK